MLESPETGIIDSHQYMTVLAEKIATNDGVFFDTFDMCHRVQCNRLTNVTYIGILALQTRLLSAEKTSRGSYVVTTEITSGSEVSYCTFETESIVNCAGLHADKVAEIILGEKISEYKLYPCRGHYFGYFGK